MTSLAVVSLFATLICFHLLVFYTILPQMCHKYHLRCRCNMASDDILRAIEDPTTAWEDVHRAEQFVSQIKNNAESTKLLLYNRLKKADIAIGIVGVNRPIQKQKYFTRTTAALLQLLLNSKSEQETLGLAICNVNANPMDFAEFQNFSSFVPAVRKYQLSVNSTKKLDGEQIFQKEMDDYSYCLEQLGLMASSAQYFLLLEDDAKPISSFLSDLHNIIGQLRLHHQVAFVKLFHPEHLRKVPWVIQVISFSLLVSFFCSYLLFRFCVTRSRPSVSFLFFLLCSALLSRSLYCLGHETFALLRYNLTGQQIYLTPNESCCTPAVIFPAATLPTVLKHLQSAKTQRGYHKDHILDEIPSLYGLTSLMSDLDLINHIGKYSSLRKSSI